MCVCLYRQSEILFTFLSDRPLVISLSSPVEVPLSSVLQFYFMCQCAISTCTCVASFVQMQVDELQNLADRVHEEYADLARRCLDIKEKVAELDGQLVAETEKLQGECLWRSSGTDNEYFSCVFLWTKSR